MSSYHRPRFGSLQFWPRKKAEKILPNVNWNPVEERASSKSGILGFIGYKAGQLSAIVKDNTANSLTKGVKIVIPVSIIECPPMKIFSVRFYKNKQVAKDIVAPGIDKEKVLARVFPLPKKINNKLDDMKPEEYDDIHIIAFSLPDQTAIKKTPDIIEIGLKGTLQEKFNIAKNFLGKEIKIEDVVDKNCLIDVRATTRGKGTQGPVKRFGISLKQYKTQKGVRKPGTLGPQSPRKVIYNIPMSGQLGNFTRINYNVKVIDMGKGNEKNINPSSGFKHFGTIRSSYIIVKGSVSGSIKKPILLTCAFRPLKRTEKENFELVKLE